MINGDSPAPIFTAKKRGGKVHLHYPDRYNAYLAKLPENAEIEVIVRLPRKDASPAQKTYFGKVILWVCKHEVPRFAGWPEREIKEHLYKKHAPRNEENKIITLRDMSHPQANEFFEGCRNELLLEDGVQCPLPNETEFMR